MIIACSKSEPIKRLSRHGFQDIDDSLAVGSTNLEYLRRSTLKVLNSASTVPTLTIRSFGKDPETRDPWYNYRGTLWRVMGAMTPSFDAFPEL